MKISFTFLFVFFISIFTYAQASYSDLVTEADKAYKEKSYEKSGQSFDAAFAVREGRSGTYYNAACSWALAGQKDKAIVYLDKSIDKGWTDLAWMQKDSDLESLYTHKEWPKLISKLEKIVAEIEKHLNKPLKEELEGIYVEDQKYRRMIDSIEEAYGRDSPEMKAHWDLINEKDSINEKRVVEIISEYGWPGSSLVGKKGNVTVWLVIQHAPLETQEKYLPLLQESVKKGESRGSNLALLEDRILMRNGKPQKYGSQVTRDKETGEPQFHEIMDPSKVNERRAAVGLGPIEEYAKRFGFEYVVPEN